MYGGSEEYRGSHRGKGPRNYKRTDDRIKEDLSERLTEDDTVDASSINIEVKQGVVTLEGTVEQRWLKHRIEDMAESCSGVRDVVNHIRVERNGSYGSSSMSGSGSSSGSGSMSSGSSSAMSSGSSSGSTGSSSGSSSGRTTGSSGTSS